MTLNALEPQSCITRRRSPSPRKTASGSSWCSVWVACATIRDWSGEEELAEARDGFLAAGDREAAAEAVLMLSDLLWNQGNREA